MTIGQRVRMVRKSKNMNQTEFASILKCSIGSVSFYESGNIALSTDILEILKNEFQVNLNWLITGEGEMFLSSEVKKEPASPAQDSEFSRLKQAYEVLEGKYTSLLKIYDVTVELLDSYREKIGLSKKASRK